MGENKRFVVDASEEQHRRVRVRAAEEGITIGDLIRRAIDESLDRLGAPQQPTEPGFTYTPPSPRPAVQAAQEAPKAAPTKARKAKP